MSKSTAPMVTLITPMYNESREIEENLSRILAWLDASELSVEYLLVDDGSTDDSYDRARRLLAERKDCRIIHYKKNRGRGYALRSAFAQATGDFVIATESDLSCGTTVISSLLTTLRETGADMVIASIHRPGGGLKGIPVHRRLVSSLGNRLLRWAFSTKLTMITGMTRGYRREAIQSLYLEEDRKEVHLEIVSKAQALGWHIEEIPIVMEWSPGRTGGNIWRFVLPHLAVTFHRGAVRFLVFGALLAAVIGVPTVVISAIHKVHRLFPYPLPYLAIYGFILCVASLVCSMFAMLGLQMAFMYRSLIHVQQQVGLLRRQLREAPVVRTDDTE